MKQFIAVNDKLTITAINLIVQYMHFNFINDLNTAVMQLSHAKTAQIIIKDSEKLSLKGFNTPQEPIKVSN